MNKLGTITLATQFRHFLSDILRRKICTEYKVCGVSVDNDQLDAHLLYFTMRPLQSSTCFKHYMLIIRRLNCIYAASGIVLSVSGRPVHRLRENSKHKKKCVCVCFRMYVYVCVCVCARARALFLSKYFRSHISCCDKYSAFFFSFKIPSKKRVSLRVKCPLQLFNFKLSNFVENRHFSSCVTTHPDVRMGRL